MRFTQFFLLAPALLAAAQTSDQSSSASAGSSASVSSASSTGASSSSSGSSASSTSASSTGGGAGGSNNNDNDSSSSMSQSSSGGADNIVTRTFNGGQATLLTDDNGNVLHTEFGGVRQLFSSLRGNRDSLGTLMTSIPPTTYTTTGVPATQGQGGSSSGDPALSTVTFNGGQATLITDADGVVATEFGGVRALFSSLRGNRDNLGTLMTSVPATTFTTSTGPAEQTGNSDNAAPAATAAPVFAGGVIGAGLMVLGLL